MVDVDTLKIGDKVVVTNRERGRIVGTVTEVYRTKDPFFNDGDPGGIKNGMAGICYTADTDGDHFWCYQNQIERRFG